MSSKSKSNSASSITTSAGVTGVLGSSKLNAKSSTIACCAVALGFATIATAGDTSDKKSRLSNDNVSSTGVKGSEATALAGEWVAGF